MSTMLNDVKSVPCAPLLLPLLSSTWRECGPFFARYAAQAIHTSTEKVDDTTTADRYRQTAGSAALKLQIWASFEVYRVPGFV